MFGIIDRVKKPSNELKVKVKIPELSLMKPTIPAISRISWVTSG